MTTDPLADASAVLDSLGVYVYTKDRDGNYVYANQPVQELFGHPLAEIVGKDDSAFFDLDRSNDLRRNDDAVMSSGETVHAREVDIVKETGEERIYWTIKNPIRNDAGEVIGLCGVSVDITGSEG